MFETIKKWWNDFNNYSSSWPEPLTPYIRKENWSDKTGHEVYLLYKSKLFIIDGLPPRQKYYLAAEGELSLAQSWANHYNIELPE